LTARVRAFLAAVAGFPRGFVGTRSGGDPAPARDRESARRALVARGSRVRGCC
jgi:hypothetical protein